MPSETVELAFGDVVLVPIPFTDQTASKQRPAVVISAASYNAVRPDIILMVITSQLRATAAYGEIWLSHWQDAVLLKPSAVKRVIATLEQHRVIRRLGALDKADAQALHMAIATIIGDAASR